MTIYFFPRSAMKVDLMRVYDMVHWDFLMVILMVGGFPEKVIGWIEQ